MERRKIATLVLLPLAICGVMSLSAVPILAQANGDIVISQIYSGGGQPGSTFQASYIEVFNRSNVPVNISGWPFSFASATGSFSFSIAFVSSRGIVISPGRYLLIQVGPAGVNGGPLPVLPDFVASQNIEISGKVALSRPNTFLTGPCPLPNSNVMDFVGYGSAANCFEGSGPVPTLSITTAAVRGAGGCTDTDNNAGDFAVGTPNPRNSGSPPNFCSSAPPTVQLSETTYNVTESSSSIGLTVTRIGNTSGASTVDYATSDTAGLTNCNEINNTASARCDYATSVGRLSFVAGESFKIISIPLIDDSYAEGQETFTISLSNPIGATLGTPSSATIRMNDNESTNGPNPIALTTFFVRQHYIDFLNREPDPPGFIGWRDLINNCPPGDTTCDRVHVSSAFYRSPEFSERGYFVYRFYPVSFGRKPDFAEFVPDLARVSGFLSTAELEAAKLAFINDFMARPAFTSRYNGLNNTQYVDTLLTTAGVMLSNRQELIDDLEAGRKTRAEVLRLIVESAEVSQRYFNQAFVVMQYFGYLRRDPDALYLNWIQELDTTGDFRVMVTGFVNSPEYRSRFGP